MLHQGFVKVLEKHGVTPHAEACMIKIREILSKPPRPPGNWWAHEVIAKFKAGHPTSIAALELAESALGHQAQRIPGEDEE